MVLKHWFPRSVIAFLTLTSVALAGAFNRQPAGLIKGARLSYVSGTTIKVGVGYGEDAGEYWEIAPTDAYNTTGFALTGLAPSTNGVFQYIYIDKANSLFPAVTLINSTTAPAWSDSYMGWYNGDNRCVGAVFVKSDGTLMNFSCITDEVYSFINANITLLSDTNISTTQNVLHTLDCSTFSPVNACSLRLGQSVWVNYGTNWVFCWAQIRPNGGPLYTSCGSNYACAVDWAMFPRGYAKTIQYQAWASSTSGNEAIYLFGYQLER